MSDDTSEDAIERGLEAYFAGETVKDLLEGIDVDALADGEALGDAVEYEQLGKALGALIGRAAAKSMSSSGVLGRFVKESFGSEVGGRAGEMVAVRLVEHGNPEALAEQLQRVSDGEQFDRLGQEIGDAIAGSAVEELGAADETDFTEIDVVDENDG